MVPAGSSLADTRRQLVLRTFATTNGDAARTAKIVGISQDEVRSEISALIRTNGHHTEQSPVATAEDKTKPARTAAPVPAKAKPKKK